MIAENAGADSGWVLKTVEENKGNADFGFNAMTMQFGSMIAAGVIDPVKVTRSAVQNAVSVGMMILTTEALITDIPEKRMLHLVEVAACPEAWAAWVEWIIERSETPRSFSEVGLTIYC